MANTFAAHILRQVAAGSRRLRPANIGAAANPSGLDRIGRGNRSDAGAKRSAAAPPIGSRTTYASVVLMMAMGASSGAATAATDGRVEKGGSASIASVGISMSIPERIEVHGFGSVLLAPGERRAEVSGCVSGHGSGQYHLSAVSSDLTPLPYQLSFAADDNQLQPLTMGQTLRRLVGAGASGCADGASNARLAVRVHPTMAWGPPGPATSGGGVTLLIAPE